MPKQTNKTKTKNQLGRGLVLFLLLNAWCPVWMVRCKSTGRLIGSTPLPSASHKGSLVLKFLAPVELGFLILWHGTLKSPLHSEIQHCVYREQESYQQAERDLMPR